MINYCNSCDLYYSMMKGQYYRWRWERIVEDYNGKLLTKNDKQYDKWHELRSSVKATYLQIYHGVHKKKYRNKSVILKQLEYNREFINKRMGMLQR